MTQRRDGREQSLQMLWPGGRTAAATCSWDDGTVSDRRMVSVLNHHGIAATFFLNSGKLGMSAKESGFRDYVDADEVARLYAGHEVGGHTLDHPSLLALSDNGVTHQIAGDRQRLEELTGSEVTGFAPPFGDVDERVRRIAAECGTTYCRGIAATGAFIVPPDPMRWEPTTHCLDGIAERWRGFLATPGPGRLFSIWGHSYEYDDRQRWDEWEGFCATATVGDEPGVWWGTHASVVDYCTAWRALSWPAPGLLANDTSRDLWVRWADRDVVVAAHCAAQLS